MVRLVEKVVQETRAPAPTASVASRRPASAICRRLRQRFRNLHSHRNDARRVAARRGNLRRHSRSPSSGRFHALEPKSQPANLQAKKNQLLMRRRAGVLQLVAACRQRCGRGDVEGGDGDSRQRRGGPQPAGTLPSTGPVESLSHGRSPTRPPGRRTDSFVGNGARRAVCIHGQTIKATLCEPRGS